MINIFNDGADSFDSFIFYYIVSVDICNQHWDAYLEVLESWSVYRPDTFLIRESYDFLIWAKINQV